MSDLAVSGPLDRKVTRGLWRSKDAGRSEDYFRGLLDSLPAAIYTTDRSGKITYYNEAAVALWGHRPELGKSEWCGSWKLFWPDGKALPHAECPMAITLKERRAVRGVHAIAERPDGSRVPFLPYPTPLFDKDGELIGAVNMLVDMSDSERAENLAQRLAAIVTSSEDAIVSKDLNGVITSWNQGAERLFGYTADEAIGQPVTLIIPEDRKDEEPLILARLRQGERIEHFETVRRRKDGALVDISLSISPVRDVTGTIVGASKIARDITERRQAVEEQRLLLREMNHRIKNLFALAGGLVSLSARSAGTVDELAHSVRERLAALSRAQSLTLPKTPDDIDGAKHPATMHELIVAVMSPFESDTAGDASRVTVSGPNLALSRDAVSSIALLIHEFATNAAKYGALSTPTGQIDITCFNEGDRFGLQWVERGGPPIDGAPQSEGFGSSLARMTVQNQFKGEFQREWNREGLALRLSVLRERLTR
jgi:PAS domain S-box-containing protein